MKTLVAIVLITFSCGSIADQSVRGYTRSNGTFVAPYTRSSPNSFKFDNYSSQGNYNPYSGQRGSQRHEYSSPSIYSAPKFKLYGR